MTLSADVKRAIATALEEAGHGERTATAQRLAGLYGVSMATVYRVAGRGGTKRRRALAKPEYRDWTRIVVALAERAPKRVPLDLALEAAVAGGDIPPEAADMPVPTLRRLARELGLNERTKRTHRLHADYPMQAIQIDGSSSEHLVVAKDLGDGDYLLKLHRRPYSASGYKNKPLGPDRLRVLIYAVWDICTGYTLAHYVVGKGENAFDAMEFLCWACAAKDDPRVVMHGVPDDLWSDQGPLWKHAAARDLLERLDINMVDGEPYAKERMGGVERTHRTRWARFETALFLRSRDTIRLSELNDRLAEYSIRENGRQSRTPVNGRAAVTRTDAWVALTNGARPADNPLRRLPDNPIETLAREAPRKIDVNGIVKWRSQEYECVDWHDRWVIVRQAIDGQGDLVLEDEETGERRTATRYVPRPYGEIRAVAKTPLDKLRDDPPETAGADLYGPRAGDDTVVPIPARIAPAAELDNPLDGARCVDLDGALRLFAEIYPYPLTPVNRQLVIERLTDAGLRRDAVVELAQELLALARQA